MDPNLANKAFLPWRQNTLAEFIMMKNNIRAQSPLFYHIKVPAALYEDNTKPKSPGNKRRINEAATRNSRKEQTESPTKPKRTKLQLHDLFIKHFTKGIWSFNLKIRFREMCKVCNVPVASLHNDPKTCFLGMFNQCSYGSECNKIYRMATTEEATHIINLLDKAIKKTEQITHAAPGENGA